MKHNVKIITERRKDSTGNIISSSVPLFADIRFSGIRMFYFTGYRIDTKYFDKEKQEAKKNTKGVEGKREVPYNEINQRLKALKATLVLHFQNRDNTSKEEIKSLLDSICKKSNIENATTADFFELFYKYHEVYRISLERKKHVLSTIKHWERYQDNRNIKLTFNTIVADTLRDFESYLRSDAKKKISSKNVFIHKPIGVNTIHTYMKITRDFWLNFATPQLAALNVSLANPYDKKGYKIPSEVYGKPIYITAEERNIIINSHLPNDRLMRVRDIFIFQCFIGARISDLKKLTKENIQNNILHYIPRKTKDGKAVTVSIPLHDQAIKIIDRYNLPNKALLPFLTDQKYNDYIKELFQYCGITRLVSRRNPTSGEPEQVRICDIASSHMARRVFIGTLYGKVDSGIISSMSGHTPGSRAFARYYDVSTELQKDAISKL